MQAIQKMGILLIMTAFSGHVKAQFFINPVHPIVPGQRELRITIDLKNVAVSKFSSSVVYGTDSLAVINAFSLAGKNPSKYFETAARLTAAGGGKAIATAILPHSGKPAGNSREKAFPKGTKLYYAWTRTHTPEGFTEALTLNSPVYSYVVPRPLTIAYMGDSYASGEGGKGSGNWLNAVCHRSALSGGELAIQKLKNRKKELEIDYINTTCSGARLLDYFAEAQKKEPGKTGIKQGIQADLVTQWLKLKNYDGIDILLADGGGNDIGFGNIVEGGLLSFFKDLTTDTELREDVQRELDRLPETFQLFKLYLESKTTVGRYVWFNYPNPLTGNPLPNGEYDSRLCRQSLLRMANPADCWGPLENNVADNEWDYVYQHVFKKLNRKIAEAVAANGWDLVDVSDRAIRKGVCNCTGYFNTVGQSILSQGDASGTMHPNTTGFREIYRDPLYNQLVQSITQFHKQYPTNALTRSRNAVNAKARATALMKANASRLSARLSEQQKFTEKLRKTLKPARVSPLKKIN